MTLKHGDHSFCYTDTSPFSLSSNVYMIDDLASKARDSIQILYQST